MIARGLLVAAAAACSVAMASPLPAAEQPWSGRIAVVLDGALVSSGVQDKKPLAGPPKPLELYAACNAGQWGEVWGSAQTFNRGIHDGQALSGEVAGDHIKLSVKLTIEADNWIRGGDAAYELDLTRKGDKLEGTYSGTFKNVAGTHEVKGGKVTGIVLPPNQPPAGYAPPQPGEHPRLLFRKADLPKIKARAETPMGKAIVEYLKQRGDCVSLGMMYQLTGDKSYAAKAFPATENVMANRNGGAFALGRFWGYRTEMVGFAYDLCYDAWTPEQRAKVENYLDDIIDLCLNRKHRVGSVNWSPGSNYTVVIHGGNGIAAMALMGEKIAAPAEPPPLRTELLKLEPPKDFTPGTGVPIVPMPVGKMPTEWIWCGPFSLNAFAADDCLASIGGTAKALPQVGTSVAFRDEKHAFEPLNATEDAQYFVTGTAGGPAAYGLKKDQVAIATPKLAAGEQRRLFFFNVIDNDKPGWYSFKANFWNGQCYVAGNRITDGEIIYLDKGRYPWLVPVAVGSPTGTASPQFVESSEEQAKAFYADPARQKAYEQAQAAWKTAMDAWTANNGVNQTWLKDQRQLEHWNYLNLQSGMGNGGFQGEGEGYTIECHHIPHDYACAYQVAMGRSASGMPDISHFVARYVHDALWKDNGRAWQHSFGGHGGGTVPVYYFSRAIALCPPEWKPALLWHWLKLAGVTHEQVLDGSGVGKLIGDEGHDVTLNPIWTLLNYPMDVKPQNPQELLPRVWEAATRGYYSFRNAWNGSDDIIAQFYGRTGQSCGWNQAETGCFQIYGLGAEWAYKDNDAYGKTGSRWCDNVVILPDDPINASGYGKTTFFSADQKTGSGCVTINMDGVYKCWKSTTKAGAPAKADDDASDAPAPTKEERTLVDGGITGLRSFAADYTGGAGVPGLFAVVDKINGGHKKIWVFQLPRKSDKDPGDDVTIEGNAFTIKHGDATLKATFVSPKGVKIAKGKGPLQADPASGVKDVGPEYTALHATGADDNDGDFFVIMTLQKGNAPAVTIKGDGLKAAATIGGQTVHFDGQKIVIGK